MLSFYAPVIAAHIATILLGLEPRITKYFIFLSLQTILVNEIALEVLYWERSIKGTDIFAFAFLLTT